MHHLPRYLFIITLSTLAACNNKPAQTEQHTAPSQPERKVVVPEFNADSAYAFVKAQVDFGPRVSGTTQHTKCGDYLVRTLKMYADTVIEQYATGTTFDNKKIPMRNIIASFNPANNKRILLCAHWDTRPWADQDSIDPKKPILGANDGASGVAVLLEMARSMRKQKPDIGVDIVFFDAEDWGSMEKGGYCLGSQYWAANPHSPGYSATYGILLDMVGGKNAQFALEDNSLRASQEHTYKIWRAAHELDYSKYFIFRNRPGILDDHFYINQILHVPTIDIISFDDKQEGNGFGDFWHTHRDNMDIIDPATLRAVGHTVMFIVYHE